MVDVQSIECGCNGNVHSDSDSVSSSSSSSSDTLRIKIIQLEANDVRASDRPADRLTCIHKQETAFVPVATLANKKK